MVIYYWLGIDEVSPFLQFFFHLQSAGENKWKMSFVMPAKYGSNLPRPKDPSVTIKEVPSKIVAVAAFSGPYLVLPFHIHNPFHGCTFTSALID